MKDLKNTNLPFRLFIFGSCFAVFHILPAFLNFEIKHRFMVAEIVDLLTPYVVILIIYKIYRAQTAEVLNTKSWTKILLILG